jgi:hypothetical protein
MTHPTALADQTEAAAREADRATRALSATGRAHLNYLTAPTPWLAAKLAQLHAAIVDGTASGCAHLSDGPRVAFAAVWAPGLLVCAHCAPLLTPDAAEDSTCDKCRARVALIYPRSATLGPLIYAYGLCTGCAETEPDGHAPNRAYRRRPRR